MKTLLKTTMLSMILSTALYSNDMFVDISTGYSYNPYTKKDISGSITIDKIDKSGWNLYDIAVGYRFNENVFSTINYQYSKFKQIDYDDYYLTLNYQFNSSLKPYIGVLAGKSYLHWNKDPLNNSQNIDWTSGSFMYGLQIGLEYKVNEDLTFIPRVIHSRTDHGTNLISAPVQSYIEHDSKTLVLFGLRFRF